MLSQDIQQIRDAIKGGRFTNEAAVCQGIVLRILHALSWPTYDTGVVSPEYSVEGRRVDFALCHPAGRPAVFIEVKQVGQSDASSERQLFEYAFHRGVPMAIPRTARTGSSSFRPSRESTESAGSTSLTSWNETSMRRWLVLNAI
jgi:predicted type IV restriction endonuclease